jgi:hypothetical protein
MALLGSVDSLCSWVGLVGLTQARFTWVWLHVLLYCDGLMMDWMR